MYVSVHFCAGAPLSSVAAWVYMGGLTLVGSVVLGTVVWSVRRRGVSSRWALVPWALAHDMILYWCLGVALTDYVC